MMGQTLDDFAFYKQPMLAHGTPWMDFLNYWPVQPVHLVAFSGQLVVQSLASSFRLYSTSPLFNALVVMALDSTLRRAKGSQSESPTAEAILAMPRILTENRNMSRYFWDTTLAFLPLTGVIPNVSTGSTLDARIILPAIMYVKSKFAVAFPALVNKEVKSARRPFVIPAGPGIITEPSRVFIYVVILANLKCCPAIRTRISHSALLMVSPSKEHSRITELPCPSHHQFAVGATIRTAVGEHNKFER